MNIKKKLLVELIEIVGLLVDLVKIKLKKKKFIKNFLAYYYPAIKKFTRKYWNLGIYEILEKKYKITDDTYYQGEEISEEEQEGREGREGREWREERSATKNNFFEKQFSYEKLDKFEDKFDELLIWKSEEQGNTYRCDTFARNNLIRSAMLTAGLKPQQKEVIAYDPSYLATKIGNGKTGTNVDDALKHATEHGVPTPCWTSMKDHNTELEKLETKEIKEIMENAYRLSYRPFTGKVKLVHNFNEAVKLDRELPENWLMQVSITFCKSLKYFRQKKPFLEKSKRYFDIKKTGGHSVHGVRHSFSEWKDGDNGFVILDSAYLSHEDGWRFLSEHLMDLGLVRIRFIECNIKVNENIKDINKTINNINTIDYSINDLNISPSQYRERNKNVEKIQLELIRLGFSIFPGATGYYGDNTKKAVLEFQKKYSSLFEEVSEYYKKKPAHISSNFGERFGRHSIEVLKKIYLNKNK